VTPRIIGCCSTNVMTEHDERFDLGSLDPEVPPDVDPGVHASVANALADGHWAVADRAASELLETASRWQLRNRVLSDGHFFTTSAEPRAGWEIVVPGRPLGLDDYGGRASPSAIRWAHIRRGGTR
jgi:hypothetical protein